jgi:hypothetical protein
MEAPPKSNGERDILMGQAAVTKKREEPVGMTDALNARVAAAVTSARVSAAGLAS